MLDHARKGKKSSSRGFQLSAPTVSYIETPPGRLSKRLHINYIQLDERRLDDVATFDTDLFKTHRNSSCRSITIVSLVKFCMVYSRFSISLSKHAG